MRVIANAELTGIKANDGKGFSMTFDVPSGYEIVAVADWVSSAWEIALTKASIDGPNKLALHAYNCNATVAHDTVITVSVLCMGKGR